MLEEEKWRKVKEIFQAALILPFAERQTFIERETNGDAEIREEVETLLEAHDEAGEFINEAAFSVADFVETTGEISLIGEELGAYKIEKEIGRGGMGAVYLAGRADQSFDKKVAVKLIKRGFDTDEIIKRFQIERQILAALDHPNITRLIDGGATADGSPYLVMDYVEGEPLTEYIERQNLSIKERLEIFLKICSAVSYAHQNLIIHRDLKPSNVLITKDGTPKLLDFGIAKLIADDTNAETQNTAMRAMTPEYASPEQVSGKLITTATDVYSLGVILYELLAGERPFVLQRKSADEISKIITEREPLKPSSAAGANPKSKIQNPKSLRGDLDNIVLMAMRKEPERRYSSVEQFADDIRRYLDGQPIAARPSTFSYRAEKFVKRNKILVGAGASLALSLIGGIAATTRQARIARRQRDRAEKTNKFLQKMLNSPDPRERGKDVKVIEILELAAQSIEKDFAGEPEIIADLRTTIGLTFLNLGQLESAESHLENALEIRLEILGRENFQTANSLNNYGKLRQAKGDLRQAETLFRQSLSILRRSSNIDEMEFAAVLSNLGFLLLLEGNYTEAIAIQREELEIVRGRLGENHPETARSLGSLANIYNSSGDWQTAEPMLRKALAITEKFYGERHPDTASAMLHLGIPILRHKTAEAENLFRRTLDLRREIYGDEHTETAWALYYLGEAFFQQQRYESAAECAKEIIKRRAHSIPETHPIVHSTQILFGRILLAVNRPSEAESYLRESLKLREDTLPANHWLIASAKSVLGECLWKIGQIEAAEPLLKNSYEALKEKLGAENWQVQTAKVRLEKFVESTDQHKSHTPNL